jgi:hypothetical protein
MDSKLVAEIASSLLMDVPATAIVRPLGELSEDDESLRRMTRPSMTTNRHPPGPVLVVCEHVVVQELFALL